MAFRPGRDFRLNPSVRCQHLGPGGHPEFEQLQDIMRETGRTMIVFPRLYSLPRPAPSSWVIPRPQTPEPGQSNDCHFARVGGVTISSAPPLRVWLRGTGGRFAAVKQALIGPHHRILTVDADTSVERVIHQCCSGSSPRIMRRHCEPASPPQPSLLPFGLPRPTNPTGLACFALFPFLELFRVVAVVLLPAGSVRLLQEKPVPERS